MAILGDRWKDFRITKFLLHIHFHQEGTLKWKLWIEYLVSYRFLWVVLLLVILLSKNPLPLKLLSSKTDLMGLTRRLNQGRVPKNMICAKKLELEMLIFGFFTYLFK
jgi:hypothetical protein